MNIIKKTFEYGGQTVTLETGRIARQADGAVLASIDDTSVLVTVVGNKRDSGENNDFFPLSVYYQERTYAAGRIPGGYFKREGRPTEKETLTSRLIDRPIRPLFPKGFKTEVQVIATVMSVDANVDPDIIAMLGTSAALAISGVPFNGPIGGARVGYKDGNYLLNPTIEEQASSELNLVVAGTENAVLMVESEAKELSEDIMLGAVNYGHQQMQTAIAAIKELAAEAGKPRWEWQASEIDTSVTSKVTELTQDAIKAAYQIADKTARQDKLVEIRQSAINAICIEDSPATLAKDVTSSIEKLEKDIVRTQILGGSPRIDGRDTRTVRPIKVETGVLARTHGSSLFTRGETQAIVTATLGTEREAQMFDSYEGVVKDAFMLHYNFPPFSVGETGFMGGPKRREIGHGRLAKRAIAAVLPSNEEFPYVLRVVSEITESNGSSSMATVCGTSLALMDAGVPIKEQVAGIAMGLILEENKYAVLTDILGDEDHLGDMDFKVAGTKKGVTALQMDIKVEGINEEIMAEALDQAREGRLHILEIMDKALAKPRTELSSHAPRITTMKVHPDKIRDIIGKGGATIKNIVEETGVSIDIDDDGVVKIAAVGDEAAQAAIKIIEGIIEEPEVGKIYEGKVMRIVDFGAFVNVLPGRDGLLHISQISDERIENVSDVLEEGQMLKVKVIGVDRQGKIKLTRKELDSE